MINGIPLLQDISRVHEGIVMPFLESVSYQGLSGFSPHEREKIFLAGNPAHDHLVAFLSQLDGQNASSSLTFVASSAPFKAVVVPIIDHLRRILTATEFSSACLHGLNSLMSQWEAGASPADNDSVLLAEALHAEAGKMPLSSAISIARVASHRHRRSAGMGPALDWLVDRCAVNPSVADSDRNVWHEAIALAIALTRKNQVHPEFVVFDDMPLAFTEKMCARHWPGSPMTSDPRSTVRRLVSPANLPADGDMVGLLNDYCGAITGLRQALSLQQSRSMERGTQTAASMGPAGPRL